MGHVLERLRFIRDHRWSPGHMSEYIDADLDAAGRERMERHAGDCPDCRDLLSSLGAMVAALGSMPGQPADSVARAVLAGVHERLGSGDDRPV